MWKAGGGAPGPGAPSPFLQAAGQPIAMFGQGRRRPPVPESSVHPDGSSAEYAEPASACTPCKTMFLPDPTNRKV
eukprot:6452916-Prymnesium_polylepis.1